MTTMLLRPDPDAMGAEWRDLVTAEREQTERLREWHETDYYRPVAQHFVEDPRRAGDEMLNALRSFCAPDVTWLDVGAGGGRNALPLALLSKRVTAIEPSEAMREVLTGVARDNRIENVEVLPLRWPEGSESIQVDYSLMAHVGYDIVEINPFLDALERSTRKRCFASMMAHAPSSGFETLWQEVHGEPRYTLPAMREFLHLLLARGAVTRRTHLRPRRRAASAGRYPCVGASPSLAQRRFRERPQAPALDRRGADSQGHESSSGDSSSR